MSVETIAQIFPDSVRPMDNNRLRNLYVDVSGLVRSTHASCIDELQSNVFQTVKDKVKCISPQLLFVAFDGSLPLVKLADRRRNIYKQMRSNHELYKSDILSMAGTSFMHDLSKQFAEHFKTADLKYIVSPMSTANDSACKIASAIGKTVDDTIHIVCGVTSIDAFVSITLEKKTIYFDLTNEDGLDLTALRQEIMIYVGNSSKNLSTTCLRDICFLLILDRLAPLPNGRCSLKEIMNAYGHALRTSQSKSIYQRTMHIDTMFLKNVLTNMYMHRGKEINTLSDTKKSEIRDEKWRRDYWKHIFNIDVGCVAKKRAALKDYFRGLAWLADSLNSCVADWHWFYQYDAAPPMQDVIEYIDMGYETLFAKNRPLKPLESLAIACDYKSLQLLPIRFREQAEMPKLAYMYPEDVETISVNADVEIVRLPCLEPFIVVQAIKSAKLSSVEKERNKLDR